MAEPTLHLLRVTGVKVAIRCLVRCALPCRMGECSRIPGAGWPSGEIRPPTATRLQRTAAIGMTAAPNFCP